MKKIPSTRREFIKSAALLGGALGLTRLGAATSAATAAAADNNKQNIPDGFVSLFDGATLNGWSRKPRDLKHPSLGKWEVKDGAIIGGQDVPGLGSYLVSDETFGDFELMLDAKPDWPADTGFYVRANSQGKIGYQVLIDYRANGGIGGFYGNGIGSFHAWQCMFTAERDAEGRVLKLIPHPPVEPNKGNKTVPLDFAAPPEVFLKAWKLNDWNTFRLRAVGGLPLLTTWINGEKIAELDTAKMQFPGWNPKAVLATLGRSGHISLEVHDGDPARWGPGALSRWRNICVKKLQP